MKVKLNIISAATVILSVFALALVFTTCNSDGYVRDLGVTPVSKLYAPDNGQAVVLQPSASSELLFDWAPAQAEDGGVVMYEVVFDTDSGNFSNPVYMALSDSAGAARSAAITHRQLNRIAAMAGIEPSASGTLKWTVFASKGVNPVKASEERIITITRLSGFADIPDRLFITGEATELGGNLSESLATREVEDGVFEIYTKLEAGKLFSFVDDTKGQPAVYSLNDGNIVSGGASTVPVTGVYKYRLDFNTGRYTTKQVTKVNMFLCMSQMKIELPYKGRGVWEARVYTINGLTGIENTDDRYKFRMESSTGETEWRAESNSSKPMGDESYYYMVERDNVEQWTNNQTWKSPSTTGWNGKAFDIVFSLSAAGEYTHNLIIK